MAGIRLKLDKKRLLVIGLIALVVLLMMDLNSRLSELSRLGAQRDLSQTQLANLKATEQALLTQIAYATSEVAVEEWARVEGRLVKPGDILVVPLSPDEQMATPVTMVTPTPQSLTNWKVWQALFFGE